MRRPLPPDLVALGDQLECAARRRLGHRRTRRQTALNVVASVAIAVPLFASLGAETPRQALRQPAVPHARTASPVIAQLNFDVPPRRVRSLVNPSPSPVPDPPGAQR